MRIVFDLDDTICRTRNRDYVNAEPLADVVDNIRKAKAMGHYIIIHTARGMLSCNGSVEKAEAKNRKTIEDWLDKNRVPYDEIFFGKPYADLYVDDKAVNLTEWCKTGVQVMLGFSGNEVYHVGNFVIKPSENAVMLREWFEQFIGFGIKFFKVPEIYSAGNGYLTMSYIKGNVLSDVFSPMFIPRLVLLLNTFKERKKDGVNDLLGYVDFIEKRANGNYNDFITNFRKKVKNKYFKVLQDVTFCHGDFTLQNIISSDEDLYLIDPSLKEWNNYLFDAAKMRASLNGLDVAISKNGKLYKEYAEKFDSYFSEQELNEMRWVEISHFIRVRHFAEMMSNARSISIIDSCIESLLSKL